MRFWGIYVSENFIPVKWSPELQKDVKDGKYRKYHVTTLLICPLQALERREKEIPFEDETKARFIKGTGVHWEQEVFNKDGFPVLKEVAFWIQHKEHKYIISGKPDAVFVDFDGIYIMDYKTMIWGAFWHRMKNGPTKDNILQLSQYGFLIYLHNGKEIKRGVIKNIAREDPKKDDAWSQSLGNRTQLSLETDLLTLEIVESFYESHPLILYDLGRIPREALVKFCHTYNLNHAYICKTCPVKECEYSGK